MAPLAARRLSEMISFGERIVAIEMVVASQALDLKERKAIGQGVRRAHELVRTKVPFLDDGDSIVSELEPLIKVVREEISKL